MRFIDSTPTGRNDARIGTGSASIYHPRIIVKVFDQDDFIGGDTWRLGDLGIPRWEHTFTARGDAVYKPSSGDSHKYKAVVITEWVEETASGGSWTKTASGTYRALIENLRDGGQWIDIRPKFGVPRDIDLAAGLDSPAPNLFATDGVVYLINAEGGLQYYHHDTAGNFDVGGKAIGSGFGGAKWVCAVRTHGLYTITTDGTLRYYHHDGSGDWDEWNGRTIGNGWAGFAWVGAGRFGQLYAITTGGDLLYYEHDPSFNWTIGGQKIGNSWPRTKVFTGGTNCLYTVASNGDLLYYYHDDARVWKHQSMKIGNGWGGFTALTSSGNGEIYGVAPDGTLRFYRHDVDKRWLDGSGRTLGSGWGGALRVLASAR